MYAHVYSHAYATRVRKRKREQVRFIVDFFLGPIVSPLRPLTQPSSSYHHIISIIIVSSSSISSSPLPSSVANLAQGSSAKMAVVPSTDQCALLKVKGSHQNEEGRPTNFEWKSWAFADGRRLFEVRPVMEALHKPWMKSQFKLCNVMRTAKPHLQKCLAEFALEYDEVILASHRQLSAAPAEVSADTCSKEVPTWYSSAMVATLIFSAIRKDDRIKPPSLDGC